MGGPFGLFRRSSRPSHVFPEGIMTPYEPPAWERIDYGSLQEVAEAAMKCNEDIEVDEWAARIARYAD